MNSKNLKRYILQPIKVLYRRIKYVYCVNHPMAVTDRIFYNKFGHHINWDNPKDLNEKINWLKFHVDLYEWAKMADKYAVREYVKDRNLSDILVDLYGRWTDVNTFFESWDNLPEEFVLKSNNGSQHVIFITKDNGGKSAVDKKQLAIELQKWLDEKKYNIEYGELHYQFINNCIIAEEFLKDESVKSFSRSLLDYKIWCFNGKPYGCFIGYDREIGTTHHYFDFYDLDWNERTDLMSDTTPRQPIPKPQNWEKMLDIAKVLSAGHPQMRVDLYNINGKIYFGELTLTSANAINDFFGPDLLLDMGKNIELDLSLPWNEFAERKRKRK